MIEETNDLEAYQGSDLVLQLELDDGAGSATNLTGYTFSGQVRKEARASSAKLLDFSFIDKVDAEGKIKAKLSAEQLNTLDLGSSREIRPRAVFVYDIIMSSATEKIIVMAGNLLVYARATQ